MVVGNTDVSSKLRCKGISLLEKAWFSVFWRSPDDFMLHKSDIIQMNLLFEEAAQSMMKEELTKEIKWGRNEETSWDLDSVR